MANIDLTRIASNIGALNTLASLENINKQLSTHQARLASGKRINSAADDPAGLTIATKLQARSEGLKVALSNISDAKNLLAVGESGLSRINDIIVQMRNKTMQGSSDTLGLAERNALLQQMRAYASQIDDIVAQTDWNGNKLIDGSYDTGTGTLTFQTGASSSDTTTLTGLKNLKATSSSGLKIAVTETNAGGSVVVSGTSTGGAIGTAAVTNTASTSNLSTGLYQVRTYLANATAAAATVELLDAGGAVIATAAAGGTAAGDTAAFGAANLTFTLGANASTSAATSKIAFTRQNDVYITKDGSSVTSGATNAAILDSASNFNSYLSYIEGKLNTVSSQLSLVGAMSGRLTFKEEQVTAAQINIEASYSRIMNANMAEEQVNASKFTILQQTATAMLAQANQAPQFLLSLFR
jgi:flagellin